VNKVKIIIKKNFILFIKSFSFGIKEIKIEVNNTDFKKFDLSPEKKIDNKRVHKKIFR